MRPSCRWSGVQYTVCKFSYASDSTPNGRYTAIFPGFIAPKNPNLLTYLRTVHPEWATRDVQLSLVDFEEPDCGSFRELYRFWSGCTACVLSDNVTKRAFYRGSLDAQVAFIGEAPGKDEDQIGVPFVGRSGVLLDALMEAAGYDPAQVLIANPVLCRPVGPSGKDRKPRPEEIAACVKHLRELLDMVKPRAVVLLGASVRDTFLNYVPDWGKMFDLPRRGLRDPAKHILLYHPSWFLRKGGIEGARKTREWAQSVKVLRALKTWVDAKKGPRVDLHWSRKLWCSVERGIKNCKADTVFTEDA